jgi:hypothetical protein
MQYRKAQQRRQERTVRRVRDLVLFMHISLDGYVKALGKDDSGKDTTVTSSGEDPGALQSVLPELIADAVHPSAAMCVAIRLSGLATGATIKAKDGSTLQKC